MMTLDRMRLRDPTVFSLLFVNVITIFLAIIQEWNIFILLWIYWFQSVIIGFFNFLRIILLGEFFIWGKLIDLPANLKTPIKFFIGLFFLSHYGGFHYIYFIFLASLTHISNELNISLLLYVLLPAALFFINHLYSFRYYLREDKGQIHDIRKLMEKPYQRIIPMHLTIIFAGFVMTYWGIFVVESGEIASQVPSLRNAVLKNTLVLLFFLVIKTYVDVKSHISEHNKRKKR